MQLWWAEETYSKNLTNIKLLNSMINFGKSSEQKYKNQALTFFKVAEDRSLPTYLTAIIQENPVMAVSQSHAPHIRVIHQLSTDINTH